MTFFERAKDFSLHDNKMNDIKGNYTVNETNTVTKNTDVNNRYIASDVRKGNKETRTTGIGKGSDNTILYGNGPRPGCAQANPPQGASRMPAGVAAETFNPARCASFVPQSGPRLSAQNAVPPSVAPTPMTCIIESIQSGTWTSDMIRTFTKFQEAIRPVAQTDTRQPQDVQSQAAPAPQSPTRSAKSSSVSPAGPTAEIVDSIQSGNWTSEMMNSFVAFSSVVIRTFLTYINRAMAMI